MFIPQFKLEDFTQALLDHSPLRFLPNHPAFNNSVNSSLCITQDSHRDDEFEFYTQ